MNGKSLLVVSIVVALLFLVACAPGKEVPQDSDLAQEELEQLPDNLKSEGQGTALSGQATKWENCVDSDNSADKWNDKQQLLTKSTTSYEMGSKTDQCYTWYKGTAKEKTRLIEGTCIKKGDISKFLYWYADCDVAFGKGAKCVEGKCVNVGNVNLVLSNVKFVSGYLLQYKGADSQDKTSPKIKFKDMATGETLEYGVKLVGEIKSKMGATIKLGGVAFIVENASTALESDFMIRVDLNGNGLIENEETSLISKNQYFTLSNGVDVDSDNEALELNKGVVVSFDVTNEGSEDVSTGFQNEIHECKPAEDVCHIPTGVGESLIKAKDTKHYQTSFNLKPFYVVDNKVRIVISIDGDAQVKETNENDNLFEMVLNVVSGAECGSVKTDPYCIDDLKITKSFNTCTGEAKISSTNCDKKCNPSVGSICTGGGGTNLILGDKCDGTSLKLNGKTLLDCSMKQGFFTSKICAPFKPAPLELSTELAEFGDFYCAESCTPGQTVIFCDIDHPDEYDPAVCNDNGLGWTFPKDGVLGCPMGQNCKMVGDNEMCQ